MEQWSEIRRRVLTGELSQRAACREYDIHWQTLRKIQTSRKPPGYRRTKPRRSIVDAFLPVIAAILESDKKVHRKQRHTAKPIFERLRDEQGYTGCLTLIKTAVQEIKQRSQEVFLPLSHPPGQAQVDFGFADVLLNGELTKVALFVMTLPYSDAIFNRENILLVGNSGTGNSRERGSSGISLSPLARASPVSLALGTGEGNTTAV